MTPLARLVTRRPWWLIALALILLGLGGVVGGSLTQNLSDGGFEDPDSEFVLAEERLQAASGVNPLPAIILVVEAEDGDITTPAGQEQVSSAAATLAAIDRVALVQTPFDGGNEAFIAEDGDKAFVLGSLAPISDDEATEVAAAAEEELADRDDVLVGGSAVVGDQVGTIIEEDLQRAELLAFPILFLVALFVFRGLVAAVLPLLMGGLVIFLGFLGLGILNEAFEISVFSLNLVIGLSLGLSIDYSLLIVNRYREELARRGPGLAAITRTLQTAGRSVLFSAITVAAALAGLMIFPQSFLFSMGIGGVLVAALAAFASLVVLPAVLAVLGSRVNALGLPGWKRKNESADELTDGFWYRLSQFVMRRPGIVATATILVLVVISLPTFRINFTTVDAQVLPDSASAEQVGDALDEDFVADFSEPIILAIDAPTGPTGAAEVATYSEELAGLPDITTVVPPVQLDDVTWRVDVIPASSGLSDASQDLLDEIRSTPTELDVLAGGITAAFVDERSSIASHLPLAITIIVGVTIIALFVMTGSVLLPIKAVIMNVLTLGATLGLLVFIFQDGRLEGLLNYESVGAIDLTMPILMGAMAFGLSTDYAVFLLSRIKEAYDQGHSNDEAVAIGLQRTGRVVTAAALLFAIAIGAFATSEITLIKQLGIGTAAAVLIDATIIRAFLVPSLMKLLGEWNWWAPRPLRRLHDKIGFSEAEPPDDPPGSEPPERQEAATA